MRAATIIFASLCACASSEQAPPVVEPSNAAAEQPALAATNDFVVLNEGPWLRVSAEQRAYQSERSEHFFVRVRLDNLTDGELGVDLRDRDRALYPNQWGGLMQPHRLIIDERRAVPIEVTPELESTLRRDFDARALTFIEAHGRAEFYVDFNASAAAELLAVEEPYLYISMAGQFFVTDGSRARSVTLDDVENIDREDLIFVPPSRLPSIPPDAHVIARD
ncbi:MAG: hypothetical protein AB8H86_29915 [Polyangiales bacterium]